MEVKESQIPEFLRAFMESPAFVAATSGGDPRVIAPTREAFAEAIKNLRKNREK